MIWLTWRQFRTQTLITLAALAGLAAYLIVLGRGIHDFYDSRIVGCQAEACTTARILFQEEYSDQIVLLGLVLIGVPAVVGAFWGAPLIASEVETGTHRLAWNQSVTRTRWLAVKLAFISLFSLAVTGLLSLLLSWAAEPLDRLVGNRFSALTFDARDVAPLGYAVFGLVLGVTIGMLIRRTVPAMALTLAVFTITMIVMPLAIRPHLMTPITSTVTFTSDLLEERRIEGIGSDNSSDTSPIGISGYTEPGAWLLGSAFRPLMKADGSGVTRADLKKCTTGTLRADCLSRQNLHFSITYQPRGRYWSFQWIETAIFLALALALAGFGLRRIQRGLA